MKNGQRFADEVTAAYGSPRVEVVVNRNNLLYNGYWPNHGWISLQPTDMSGDPRLKLVPYLSMATNRTPTPLGGSISVEEVRPWQYEVNRRGVDIMVKFMNMSTRQALDTYATYLVAMSRGSATWLLPRTRDVQAFGPPVTPPCDQLRDLWTHFEKTAPMPECGRRR
jgi:hypothetical protein